MRRNWILAAPAAPLLFSLLAAPLSGCDGAQESTNPPPSTDPFGPLGEREDLPVDERIQLDNLQGPVDIVRDKYGRPHIYATSATDALRVQGYLVARDRTLQLEFLRRVSEGRMAEILAGTAPDQIDSDIAFRHIGLHRVAKAEYAAMEEGEVKQGLLAFADGVSQVFRKIRSEEIPLPDGIFGIDLEAFTDWEPADSLTIGRLQTYLLSFDADSDISFTGVFSGARATFTADSADPLVVKRVGLERDLLRFAPGDAATTTTGYPTSKPMKSTPEKALRSPAKDPKSIVPQTPTFRTDILANYLKTLNRTREIIAPEGFGSNNWGVLPSKSTTGHTLIASDPHLSLSAPAVFWPVSIEVIPAEGSAEKPLNIAGISFPGIPGIILGHNENIAWGATVAGYDVSDAYAETLSADGQSVMFNGQMVPLETIEEPIAIQFETEPYVYKVRVVPHHGPIAPEITAQHTVLDPDPAKGAVSIKWTGMEPTGEIAAVLDLWRAKDVDEAYDALQKFGVGAQNWMIGDTSGNLLWTTHARIPTRDKASYTWDASTYDGLLPCLVLPGDGSAEWTGFLADDLVPWARNPDVGYLATANNDPIGDTLDNDPSNDTLPDGTPMFLGCTFDIGFREGRIQQRIEAEEKLSLETLADIQGDHRSPMGSRLAPRLIQALTRAEEERATPGMHPDLTAIVAGPDYDPERIADAIALLQSWDTDHDYAAAAGVNLDDNAALAETEAEGQASQATLLFNTWLVRALRRTFGDEMAAMGYSAIGREFEAKGFLHLVLSDPMTLATHDASTGESAIWDDMGTPEVESPDERMVRSLLDAFAWLDDQGGLSGLRWGHYHTITFAALIPLYADLFIPPATDPVFSAGFPRHGDSFCVDASDFTYSIGVSQDPRFSYRSGPTQRFVIDMDPSGPKAFNALPGGQIWDAKSPHFRDEAEYWRKNENHAIPFVLDDVIAAKESRVVALTPQLDD